MSSPSRYHQASHRLTRYEPADLPDFDDLSLGWLAHHPEFQNCPMLIAMPHWMLLLLGVLATLRLRREAMRVGGATLRAISLPWMAWWVAAMLTTLGANAIGYGYGYTRGTFSVPTDFELFPLHLFVGLGYFVFLDRQARSLEKLPSVSVISDGTQSPEFRSGDSDVPSRQTTVNLRDSSREAP